MRKDIKKIEEAKIEKELSAPFSQLSTKESLKETEEAKIEKAKELLAQFVQSNKKEELERQLSIKESLSNLKNSDEPKRLIKNNNVSMNTAEIFSKYKHEYISSQASSKNEISKKLGRVNAEEIKKLFNAVPKRNNNAGLFSPTQPIENSTESDDKNETMNTWKHDDACFN